MYGKDVYKRQNMDIAYAFVNALGKAPDKKALGSEKAK